MNTRWFRIKAILINCGIAGALIYRYWTGTQLLTIVITGVIVFVLANVLMILAAEQSTKKN